MSLTIVDNLSLSDFCQLDGNASFCSDISSSIPVIIGNRPKNYAPNIRKNTRITIRRDNKVLAAVFLPKVSCYNMRSLMPKVNSFATDMEDRDIGVALLTEIWEKIENKRHQRKIEELYEMRGLKYFSTPRPGKKRGGGVAIVVDTSKYRVSKLNVPVPHKLEVVWALLRNKDANAKMRPIIMCCFYSPPKSKKKTKLIDHMTLTVNSLKAKYPTASVIISGDRNDLRIDNLLNIDPSLRQIVQNNTRGASLLTIVLTDLYALYETPQIVSPITVDDPSKGGVPSDHDGVIVKPISSSSHKVSKHPTIQKTIRPMPTSSINQFGQFITQEEWSFMDPTLTSSELTDVFESYTNKLVDIYFPTKEIRLKCDDKPYITEMIKANKRRLMREYEKNGKSLKYLNLKKSIDEDMERAVAKYKEKIIDDVKNGTKTSTYKALRRLGVRPGDDSSSDVFKLPDHISKHLSAEESANLIADHFSAISMEYEPINVNNFSPKLKAKFNSPDMTCVPVLTEHEVFLKIKKAKKPNSSVPGDLPPKLVKEFSCELATPITIIFNSILRSLEYPRQWVVEHQTPIPKISPPESENDLRNIAKTSFFSKVFESYLSDLLLPFVKPFLDPMQFGLKGGSINHYLIKLLQFIHTNLDLRDPHAVVLALVDLSKAFNRISHLLVIEDLHDMHVPAWLLRILTSYLTERSMILTYDGSQSSPRNLPGSSPQGAFLGIFLFIIKFNGVSLRPPVYRPCCSLRHDKSIHVS